MDHLAPPDQFVLHTVARMVDQIAAGHPRAAMIRADVQAYVSQEVYDEKGSIRGDLLVYLFWLFPGYVEFRPIADALHLLPSTLRLAVGK